MATPKENETARLQAVPDTKPMIGAAYAEAGTATKLDLPMANPSGDEENKAVEEQTMNLASFVQQQWQIFKNHAETRSFEDKCNAALRVYKGEYSSEQLAKISSFGGSTVFAHVTSTKCRGATALLRDIFLGQKQAWGLGPTKNPKLASDITSQIPALVESEVMAAQAEGHQIPQEAIEDRVSQLTDEALKAAEVKAREEAQEAEKYLQDILVEGGFYDALVDFITDLPIFPIAILKGPVVKNSRENRWVDGQLVSKIVPKMFWNRVSPFDLYYTPGASSIFESNTIEYSKVSRSELNTLIGIPGYDEASIRSVLTEYAAGYSESGGDNNERAVTENREDPHFNQSGLIDTLEWQGAVQGKLLLEYGFKENQIPDPDLDYFVIAWVIGRHVIKVQIKPDSHQRPNYYITSYEKVPGSIRGLGLPEILDDIQKMANGSLRALANNMAMSSGPQVVIDETTLSPTTDANSLYPWKRWRVAYDPMASGGTKAVDFYQPNSNATELLGVYQAMTNIADETSSIPRYLTGNERVGGAGRTASGLSMLMSSASKMIQVVSANIDRDVMRHVLQSLYDMVMLTDQGKRLRGDEDIQIRGVEIAREREMERNRKLEFLQITANPMDQQIMGMRGRAKVLRPVADDLGLPGAEIMPTDLEMQQMEQMQKMQAQQQEMAAATGEQPAKPSGGNQADEMGSAMRAQV